MADSLREGVYIQMGGPQFESVAELKMLTAMGIDAVGEARYTPKCIFLCWPLEQVHATSYIQVCTFE